eukprot:CAMPEP_0180194248 /NCGR_PEP_ID=MMETSP0987-20121128/2942_1 /TAXON_ID=697907 /ORGANISM="non described non described, Strain CCMP2293" /LENGTH=614 /DNA_ID=CAMNT_0022148989 /DNA_START=32 /DNA_END=1877 /DNA_ORIENTATION=-
MGRCMAGSAGRHPRGADSMRSAALPVRGDQLRAERGDERGDLPDRVAVAALLLDEDVFTGSGEDGRAVTGDVVDIVGVQVTDAGEARPIVFETGDGGEYPVALTVTHYSTVEDYVHGFSEITHTYQQLNDGGNDWIASLRGCCRQYGEANAKFRVTLRVNLAYDPQALMPKGLPVLPVIYDAAIQQVLLPANTDGGLPAAGWRIGNGEELGGAIRPSVGMATFVDGTSGMLSLNSSAFGVGFFPVVVQIASTRSVSPYDFLLRVVPASLRNLRPVFSGVPLQTNTSSGGLQTSIPSISTFAGYEIFLTFTASTSRPDSEVKEIRVYSLPLGARMIEGTESRAGGVHTMTADFRWTPRVEQAGTHYVCVEAIDNSTDVLSSGQHCLILLVNGVNPKPAFFAPPPDSTVTFYMEVPNTFDVSGIGENPYDNILLDSKFPLTPGQVLSPPVASEKKIRATDAATRVAASATLSWRPSRFTGAFKETLCFVLSQAGGPGIIPQTSERCVIVRVERCKYLSQAGDTVQSIGALFRSDWLSLWGINVNLTSFVPPAGTEVLIGRIYTLRSGDTLQTVSKQFGTTVEKIKELNIDLSVAGAEAALAARAEICIFPDTCFDD